ncbi:TPA: hypothetical protein NKP47_002230 [Vibrio parahaemolyticus]|uniref:hypothetical protein n=2 Tax=Vibrio parahaemolyticus TaxID=670 RepID=UPI0023606F4F|nr:hypothetical protein [Vibrio parahaemolyticus]HCH1010536.1 hypothetical protein [Vibrio parahaemolyticus]
MYSEVFSKIKNIATTGYLKINKVISDNRCYQDEDGYFRGTNYNSPFFNLYDGLDLYDNTEVNFVKSISMKIKGEDSDIKLSLLLGDQSSKTVHAVKRDIINNDTVYSFEINEIPLAIIVSCNRDNKYRLIKIKICGRNIADIVSLIEDTQNLVSRIKSDEKTFVKELNQEISDLNEEKDSLTQDIKNLIETNERLHETTQVEETQLKQTRSHVESSRADLKVVNEELEQNIAITKNLSKEQKESENRLQNLGKEINDKENDLLEIRNNLKKYKKEESKFSEDFSSFKEEIRKQNKLYYILLFAFVVIATVVGYVIYNNAMATVDNYQFNFDLWTLLVSRLPVIFINVFILGALTSVIYLLINLLTSNFNNIAKTQQVTYLVKDCVEAQSNDLNNLTEEQILKQRVESKMALIQRLIETSYEQSAPKIDDSGLKDIVTDLLKKQDKSKSS